MSQHKDSAKMPLKKIGLAVLVCGLVLFTGACGSAGNGPTAAASDAPSLTGQQSPVAEPTFTYPGGPQCKITYRDNGNGTMSWTADVTVAGELITHASDTSGNINRHDEQVTIGLNTFTASVPLSQVTDIGGVYTFRTLPLRLRTAVQSRRNGNHAACRAISQRRHAFTSRRLGRMPRSVV